MDDKGDFKKVKKEDIKGEYNVDTRYANAETNIANTVQGLIDTWNNSQTKKDLQNAPDNLLKGITSFLTGNKQDSNTGNKTDNKKNVLVDTQEEYLKRFKKK